MKKRIRAWSLAKKVYWITAVGFLAFTALFMVLQLLFFEDYSLKVRAAKLEKDFHGMYEEIREMKSDSDWLERIAKFDREHYSWTIIERKEGRLAKLLSNWPDEGTPPYLNCITPSLNKLKDMQGRDGTAVVFLDGEGDGKCWAALAPISEEGERQEYIYTFSSPQPVSDAASLLGGFYRYFFLAAVIPLLGFAFLFTRMISRPLVKLNEMAKRLARLDFSVRTEMKRDDEIGELAATFDYLATELNGTMGELQAANEQLQRDIEKEKRLELLRKRFVANVSHELKTPVSLIQGYAEMLRDNVGQGAKRDKYASVIVNEAERMSRLVKDLLDLSQLESGHFDLRWSNVPLHSTLAYVMQSVESLAPGRHLRLDWLPEDEVMVRSDPQRLEQIVTNMLTNAIHHTPEGGRIDIRVQCGDDPGFVRIDVQNEGQPIAEEHLPHLWDAFYRADTSGSSSQGGGNGIGLSIVKHLLDRHQSRYSISNIEGGVILTFTLPVVPTP
ncbi:HAMP domain-containing histidine kinase [Paenibacillus thiaminolyticus]|uniref:sensor histidine kinase n=1 Tax=Paenibacillus thiaminolyticus TaxID=49283 RepID=UPI0023307031|nr:HAMP domain-containing sensor histidine kinase [Paenibacillus thiaminolyticus]WCF08865.1 HAMP domain-containing histidine kinase [Paenibacillus thiaminolyticus]